MTLKHKLLLTGLAVASFVAGYGALALAYPSPAPFGRAEYHGYYFNNYDDQGTFVLDDKYSGGVAIPSTVNSAATFISFMDNDAKVGASEWDLTGASFIIETMLGVSTSSTAKPATASMKTSWANLVNAYAAAGRVSWNTNWCYSLNTFYQAGRTGTSPYDDAWFDDSGCDPAIVFTNPDGSHYAIRRQCANPIGFPAALKSLQGNFNMTGKAFVNNANPTPGTKITFTYQLINSGPNSTSPTNINWHTFDTISGTTTLGPNKGVYGVATYPEGPDYYTVPIGTPAGTKICRAITLNPSTQAGGSYQSPQVCATVSGSYALAPNVISTVKDGGGTVVGTDIGEPGDTITFTYKVTNGSLSDSPSVTCTIYGLTKNGSYSPSSPYDQTSDVGYVPPGTGCPRVFTHGTTVTLATETVAVTGAMVGKTVCRTLVVHPGDTAGNPQLDEACVVVPIQPYFNVLGGDVMAGPGFGDGCTENPATISSWNTNTSLAPNYAGAGSQLGAWATDDITNFVSGMGLNGGAASQSGYGLSFANDNNTSGSGYGGNFGANALPCAYDYFNNEPGGSSPMSTSLTSFTGVASGNYDAAVNASGFFTLGGAGNLTLGTDPVTGAGQQISIYVEGDVYINSDILYAAYATIAQIPRLNLYVQGNIYIDNNISQLHGVYVAQEDATGNGGTITTCTTGAAAVPQSYATCNHQLTFVGAVAAEGGLNMNRTYGSLIAAPGIPAAPAEIFQYGPELWLNAPGSGSFEPQSYTGLPPVL
ncbi:MAG TPA: hypothetical protein VLF69_04840 [Candidatus Saccharimonadales bacterium]|nr:hypothetical protein [Candidatus Saccharimonadales bacterium]